MTFARLPRNQQLSDPLLTVAFSKTSETLKAQRRGFDATKTYVQEVPEEA